MLRGKGFYIYKHGKLQASRLIADNTKRIHIVFDRKANCYIAEAHVDRILPGYHKVMRNTRILDTFLSDTVFGAG